MITIGKMTRGQFIQQTVERLEAAVTGRMVDESKIHATLDWVRQVIGSSDWSEEDARQFVEDVRTRVEANVEVLELDGGITRAQENAALLALMADADRIVRSAPRR